MLRSPQYRATRAAATRRSLVTWLFHLHLPQLTFLLSLTTSLLLEHPPCPPQSYLPTYLPTIHLLQFHTNIYYIATSKGKRLLLLNRQHVAGLSAAPQRLVR
jgi:hypothetical protein